MLSFENDSSLFCDFQDAIFKPFPYNSLSMILVGRFPPENPPLPTLPVPLPGRFLYHIINYIAWPRRESLRGSPAPGKEGGCDPSSTR
jgi:hypothetical protein